MDKIEVFNTDTLPDLTDKATAYRRLERLESECRAEERRIMMTRVVLVCKRWEQGRAAAYLVDQGESARDVAKKSHVSHTTINAALSVYRALPDEAALRRLFGELEDAGKTLSWSAVKAWARLQLPADAAKAAIKMEKVTARLEQRARQIEDDAKTLIEAARTWPNGKADEAIGVAIASVQTVADSLAEVARAKAVDPFGDAAYLDYIKAQTCLNCGAPAPSVAWRYDQADHYSVPLCRQCKDQVDEFGANRLFSGAYDFWKKIASYLSQYIRRYGTTS